MKPQESCLIDLQYLPCLEYFSAILRYRNVILELHEHYVKQSYRTRCYIRGANNIIQLNIPVTEKHGKVLIRDVKIDYRTRWQQNHWRTILSSYKNAPYFEHYADQFENSLMRKHVFLVDLNLELLSYCLQTLAVGTNVSQTETYEKVSLSGIADLRSQITPKKHYSSRPFYKPVAYQQVFGSNFAENLSFIDLLFCEGPNALTVLKSTIRGDLNI